MKATFMRRLYSPLMLACEKGDIAIAEMLIAYGADVNKQYEKEDEQGYSLTLAAENGFIEIVELLLTHKADPESIKWYYDGECNFRYTPILLALIQDNQKMVELILRNGADVDGECAINCELHTPLSYAVAKNLPLWVHFFLQHGANPEKTLGDSYTVKDYAKELGRQDFLIQ